MALNKNFRRYPLIIWRQCPNCKCKIDHLEWRSKPKWKFCVCKMAKFSEFKQLLEGGE